MNNKRIITMMIALVAVAGQAQLESVKELTMN